VSPATQGNDTMTVTTNNAAATRKASVILAKAKAAKAKAKAKGPTKAAKAKANLDKANASASAKLPTMSFAVMADKLITASKANDGAARVMAHYMNSMFSAEMASFKCHWSAFSPANCRTDNEKAILARIEAMRKEVQALAEKKGLANTHKPWSDMKRVSVDLFSGGKRMEKTAKPLDTVQRDLLTKLYKAAMKEERPTNIECDVNDTIGRLLVRYFKVDLSTLG